MDAITVSSFPDDNPPPVGHIETDDTYTLVLPLSEVVVFISVEAGQKSLLLATVEAAAAEISAEPGAGPPAT